MLISSVGPIILQCIHTSNHHIVHFRCFIVLSIIHQKNEKKNLANLPEDTIFPPLLSHNPSPLFYFKEARPSLPLIFPQCITLHQKSSVTHWGKIEQILVLLLRKGVTEELIIHPFPSFPMFYIYFPTLLLVKSEEDVSYLVLGFP